MNTSNGNQHHQINIVSVSASNNSSSQLPPSNLPRRDLLDGREDFNAICVPLYKAITTDDDFKAAKLILEKRPELVQFSITESCETILHIAVLGKSCLFVQYLMSLMTKEDLELPNGNGETPLCLVAGTGNVEIAKTLVEKNEGLIDIPNSQGKMPLQVAALYGRRDMVEYLYNTSQKMTGQFWTFQNKSWVFEKCVEDNLFDLALQMVSDYPELAINGGVLRLLARKRQSFLPTSHYVDTTFMYLFHPVTCEEKEKRALQLLRIILKVIMKLPKAETDDLMRGPPDEDAKQKYSSRVLFLAAEMGNTEYVVEVIRQYPHLALEVNDDNHSIFHVAVLYRHYGIYKLLCEKDHIKNFIITLEDKNGNNMLHLVGELPYTLVMGTQMFHELRWFKMVESILPDYVCKKKNATGLTPYELFMKNHKDLFSKEQKLMKETASRLMVVAALVATISFATIFTFPGGYIQDTTGIPILLGKSLSKIFIICDSLSFLFSTTSILMVISLLICDSDLGPYFVNSPTLKIRSSMVFVLYSVISIIITYLISLFILYQNHSQWIPILFISFALISYLTVVITDHLCLFSFKSMRL